MNKEHVYFVAGLTVGAVAMKLYLDRKHEELIKEEIESVKKAFAPIDEKPKDEEADDIQEEVEDDLTPQNPLAGLYDRQDKHFNYNKPPLEELVASRIEGDDIPEDIDLPEDDEEYEDQLEWREDKEEAAAEMEVTKRRKEGSSPRDPFIIAFDEFVQRDEIYDKLELTYYMGDDVLVDENDEMVDDVNYVLGMENMAELIDISKLSGRDTTLHIRNERLGVDYEVTSVKGTYSQYVVGE